jgi:hypothetical protein
MRAVAEAAMVVAAIWAALEAAILVGLVEAMSVRLVEAVLQAPRVGGFLGVGGFRGDYARVAVGHRRFHQYGRLGNYGPWCGYGTTYAYDPYCNELY